jgi:hypothetical protein
MPKLTVKDLLELKGVRQIAFVQIKSAQIEMENKPGVMEQKLSPRENSIIKAQLPGM